MRPCLDCGQLVADGSRCPSCSAARQRQRDAARGSTAGRGYGAAWRKLVNEAIDHQPWCSRCGHSGTPDNPLTGDHVLAQANGGASTLENIQVLCRTCNSTKGAR